MSERLSPDEIARLLGSEPPVHVGNVTIQDILTGNIKRKVEQAKERVREAPDVQVCEGHLAEDELFQRTILRAVPSVIISPSEASMSFVFFDKELGEQHGSDIYDKIIACARHIVAGECAQFECEVSSYVPLNYEIRPR